ncbi:receptor expression-enhancing protein 1 isoform X3 [Cervus canadensis]|uniref:receptor expression-enhancing protein 1 isoform X3 n=1 Tax=Cervus canadensis TaxID=1574408 RepID=UPI001C9E547E|nr:receptor expression-enhancing protein 1 isoform X3 [Cervus canadensis]
MTPPRPCRRAQSHPGLIFGTLYPAYYSYKAVKSKDIKEYVKWMMYWIIFALFTTAETFTDIFLCWFPFYYELKIAFVAWLLSPYTKGSSLLYRKFVHPTLSSKEKEIDDCLVQAKDRSYDALVHFGKRGLNVAATAAVMAASKGQGALSERLRSFSMQDLSTIRGDGAPAPSGPPPPGPGRASGKHGQPKMSRSASESAGSSVVEGDVDEGGVKAWGPHQVQNPLAFSDEEEEDLLDFMYKFKAPRKTEFPLEVSPPSPSAERCNLRVQLRQVGSPPALSAETLVRLRHRLESFDLASGRKVPHPRPLKPRE